LNSKNQFLFWYVTRKKEKLKNSKKKCHTILSDSLIDRRDLRRELKNANQVHYQHPSNFEQNRLDNNIVTTFHDKQHFFRKKKSASQLKCR
jgi:hypothetical protein